MKPVKYAIRITDDTHALVQVLSHFDPSSTMPDEDETYFLFTVDSRETTTDHDVVHQDNLDGYDGNEPGKRIILQ